MQAGVTCTSFWLATQLESGDWRNELRPGTQTRGLRSNAEFQPREPPMWPRLFVPNCCIYDCGQAAILRLLVRVLLSHQSTNLA